MDFMDTVLLVGSGGREHAILKALMRSERPLCTYAYPGNPGIEDNGCMLVRQEIKNWEDLADYAVKNEIDLTVVGPEVPLVEGIVDVFKKRGLTIFGPTQAAARIEGSKQFAKDLMKKYHIPTASFETFTNKESAVEYLKKVGAPVVVKVSGLAAGKGAIVCDTLQEAHDALKDIFDKGIFGDAGNCVILEEKMVGEEASIFALTDGKTYKLLPPSQDHKAIYEGDRGPNTGGMGAYAPAPLIDAAMLSRIEREIIKPTLDAMQKEGCLYQGVLYVGVMVTEAGPKVVEFNCRFGDPETQAILPLVECDWFEVLSACAKGNLADVDLTIKDLCCATVVLASKGYPGPVDKGKIITGIDEAERSKTNVDVYQAGTGRNAKGELLTNGGRVLAVSAWSGTLEGAVKTAYENVEKISFEGKTFRKDIAAKGIARLKKQ
ncbi:MAG: phosphoribosylamine--glycine ligase [Chitinispirillaceae bacterium]